MVGKILVVSKIGIEVVDSHAHFMTYATVKEFLEQAFGYVDLDYNKYVRIDPRYYRPTEVDLLLSYPARAKKELKWTPKVKFCDLVQIMVDADLELLGLKSPGKGKKIVEAMFDGWHRWDGQVVSMGK